MTQNIKESVKDDGNIQNKLCEVELENLEGIKNSRVQSVYPQDAAPLQSKPNSDGSREVGALLGIAIFVMPYLFAWFTLRKGHSTISRVVSFSWMGFMIYSKFWLA